MTNPIMNLPGRGFLILSIRKILFIVFKTEEMPTMTEGKLFRFVSVAVFLKSKAGDCTEIPENGLSLT